MSWTMPVLWAFVWYALSRAVGSENDLKTWFSDKKSMILMVFGQKQCPLEVQEELRNETWRGRD